MAWADGHVDGREVELISKLLEQMGMPLAQRVAMMDEAMDHRPEAPPDLDSSLDDAEARSNVLQAMVSLCFADQKPHPEELKILGDLAIRWGISADQLESMRQKATGGL